MCKSKECDCGVHLRDCGGYTLMLVSRVLGETRATGHQAALASPLTALHSDGLCYRYMLLIVSETFCVANMGIDTMYRPY